jgi:hypothetical protein
MRKREVQFVRCFVDEVLDRLREGADAAMTPARCLETAKAVIVKAGYRDSRTDWNSKRVLALGRIQEAISNALDHSDLNAEGRLAVMTAVRSAGSVPVT